MGKRRGRKRWRVALVVVGSLGVLAAGAAVVAKRKLADDRPWAAMQASLDAFEGSLEDHTGERPVLWGHVVEGSAREHYDRAVERMGALDPRAVQRARRAATEDDRRLRDLLLREGGDVLRELTVGAHSRVVGTPAELVPVSTRRTKTVRAVVHLAEARAAAHRENGDDLAAVGVLLDAMQLGADLAEGPRLVDEVLGLGALLPTSVERLVDDPTLAPAARERLVDGIVALDRRLAWRGTALGTEVLAAARDLERALGGPVKANGDGVVARAKEERCACGVRTDVARQVERALALVDQHDAAFEGAPREALVRITAFLDAAADLDGADRLTLSARAGHAVRTRLATVARLRLLAHRLSEREWPRDPWLRELRTEDGAALGHPLFGTSAGS